MASTNVRLTASFLRKASAPGNLIARKLGAEKLGLTTAEVNARITSQLAGKWTEWTVSRDL